MGDNGRGHNGVVMSAAPVRTSSCTKEEVDAILIQCGRLSRRSFGKARLGVSTPSKKFSGSKRSYDFDQNDCDFGEKGNSIEDDVDCCVDDGIAETRRHRHRQSRASPQGRRRTPSSERDSSRQHQQQRSGSRDRGSGDGSGRRVSRSPGRRSDNPPITAEAAEKASSGGGGATRPGKMVSVPATSIDKGNYCGNGVESGKNGTVRRVLVKRNSGEMTAASNSKTPCPQ